MTACEKVSLKEKFALIKETFSPRIIATINDYAIKAVKSEGEFVWHSHDDTDECFLLISGKLIIRMRDGEVTLYPGELFVVPKGTEHTISAPEPCELLLIEPKGVCNTGNVASKLTARSDQYL